MGAWHAAFADEGPFSEDVASLSRYLKCVVSEEKDVDKAVSVVRWLMWLVSDEREQRNGSDEKHDTSITSSSPGGPVSWDYAIQTLQTDINNAMDERDLPPVEFDD